MRTFALAALTGVLIGLALVTATVFPARGQPYQGYATPNSVPMDAWVISVPIKDDAGLHTSPSWYWIHPFANKLACELYLGTDDWKATFKEWSEQELADHEGKVTIPPPECVQRRMIKPYADERGA